MAGDWGSKPCYFSGSFVPLNQANLNIQTHALQYGTACFGGIRAYFNEEQSQLYLFRIEDHYNRLCASAKILQMKMPLDFEQFKQTILTILRDGQWRQNTYLRPILYKSSLELSPRLHDVKDDLAIYAIPLNDYLDINKGLRTAISSWTRINDNQIPTRAKATGGYINSALAKSEALQNGFDEAIFLDHAGNISEGSAENIFIVKNKKLITPSLSSSILEGITRRTVFKIAQSLGIDIEERSIARTELYTADELFFAGTGVQIAWVQSVDRREIGSGDCGPVTTQIRDFYFEVITGNKSFQDGWLTPVYE